MRSVVAPLSGTFLCFWISACGGASQEPQAPGEPFVTGLGEPVGEPVQAEIGPDGGEISAEGLTVTVPPGALGEATTVSLQPITALAPGAVGRGMRLGPEGQTFAEPVTLSWGYTEEDVVGSAPEALLVAFQTETGIWAAAEPTLDAAGRTVAVEAEHFSDWSLVQGAQLRPAEDDVPVGETLVLHARLCYDAWPDLTPLVAGFECDPEEFELTPLAAAASGWAVNGRAGGSATTGTVVDAGAGTGRFKAPGAVPDPAVVAVSARGAKGALLVSNLTIVDGSMVHASGVYDDAHAPLTSFVEGHLRDTLSFDFSLPSSPSGVIVVSAPKNAAGEVLSLEDTRAGCLTPTLQGGWDQEFHDLTHFGVMIGILYDEQVGDITHGAGEGDCAVDEVTDAGRRITDEGFTLELPLELLSATAPPSPPLVVEDGAWTWTFSKP